MSVLPLVCLENCVQAGSEGTVLEQGKANCAAKQPGRSPPVFSCSGAETGRKKRCRCCVRPEREDDRTEDKSAAGAMTSISVLWTSCTREVAAMDCDKLLMSLLAWMVLSHIKEQYHSGYQYAILFGAKNSHLPKRHIKARPPAQTPLLAALAAVC
ncbi:hypothetical protein O3P69_000991 [Scylla paramamosain]|uniref:Uncharacterized protein n=1 Tax=Scylla paramamosain TaxID=85552 RepID=A0AAW0UXX1_SCYPA